MPLSRENRGGRGGTSQRKRRSSRQQGGRTDGRTKGDESETRRDKLQFAEKQKCGHREISNGGTWKLPAQKKSIVFVFVIVTSGEKEKKHVRKDSKRKREDKGQTDRHMWRFRAIFRKAETQTTGAESSLGSGGGQRRRHHPVVCQGPEKMGRQELITVCDDVFFMSFF
jgi:hypothetical protein